MHVTWKRDFVDPCVSGAGPQVLAWDWTQQASGFGMVGPQRSVREGVCVGAGGGGGKDFLRILPKFVSTLSCRRRRRRLCLSNAVKALGDLGDGGPLSVGLTSFSNFNSNPCLVSPPF